MHSAIGQNVPSHLETVKCAACRALLFKAEPGAIAATVEIKCRRCGAYNNLRPASP